MTTYLVDTNIILRFLVQDIPKQSIKAYKFFQAVKKSNEYVQIPHTILIEVVYHLLHTYDIPREKIADTLVAFLSHKWIKISNKPAVLEALKIFKSSKIDLVDILLYTTAAQNNKTLVSFDKDFKKLAKITGNNVPVIKSI